MFGFHPDTGIQTLVLRRDVAHEETLDLGQMAVLEAKAVVRSHVAALVAQAVTVVVGMDASFGSQV